MIFRMYKFNDERYRKISVNYQTNKILLDEAKKNELYYLNFLTIICLQGEQANAQRQKKSKGYIYPIYLVHN